jgi:hypothetical protein
MKKRILFILVMLTLCAIFVWMGQKWLLSPFNPGYTGGLGVADKSAAHTIARLYPQALVNPLELEEQDSHYFFFRWSVFEMSARSWVLLIAPCIVIMVLSIGLTRKWKQITKN